jgi:hypothetical protein
MSEHHPEETMAIVASGLDPDDLPDAPRGGPVRLDFEVNLNRGPRRLPASSRPVSARASRRIVIGFTARALN